MLSVSLFGIHRAAGINASSASGILAHSAHRQDDWSMMIPPRTGPTIGAICTGIAVNAITLPIRDWPAISTARSLMRRKSMPPPNPWITRNAMSELRDHARPAASVAPVKTARLITHVRWAPYRWQSELVSGITVAMARRYPALVHWTTLTDASKSDAMFGTAIAMMLLSTRPTNPPAARIIDCQKIRLVMVEGVPVSLSLSSGIVFVLSPVGKRDTCF